MSTPLVSVVICTYNSEKYIETTLKSVLDQTYRNLEILVLDNNSDDETVDILRRFESDHNRVDVTESVCNRGPYRGLNFLMDNANGKYIAVQDHDDIWHPEKLDRQIHILERNPKYLGCGGLAIKYFESKSEIALVNWPEIDFYAPHPSLVFRNTGVRYDDDLIYKSDMYFMKYILCSCEKRIYNIQKPLYLSRVRADEQNLSDNWTTAKGVKNFYHKTGEKRHLAHYLAMKYLPKLIVGRLRERISKNWEFKPENYISQTEFTKSFINYLNEK